MKNVANATQKRHEGFASYITADDYSIFDNIDQFAKIKLMIPNTDVVLKDEYWIKKFENEVQINKDAEPYIQSRLLGNMCGSLKIPKEAGSVSCEPLYYCENLFEVIFWNEEIRDLKYLAQNKKVSEITLVDCKVKEEEFHYLAECENLQKLTLIRSGCTEEIRERSKTKPFTLCVKE